MKKALILFVWGLMQSLAFSQTQIWKMQDYSVGQTLNSFPAGFTNASPTLSDIIQLPDSTYRLYVTVPYNFGAKHCIAYANSPDAINWTYMDTCFCGSSDSTARNHLLGGASVVKLPNGQYRMYYRTSQKLLVAPKYHVRSAISSDGINFTQEGIRIDIQPYDASSPLLLAGHGTYWQLPDNTFAGIFSGNPDTSSASGPSQFVLTTSNDGLTWGNFKPLYYGHHDPIVLKKNGQFILYGMYLSKYMTTAVSSDGLNWPASPDSVSFLDTNNVSMLVNNTKRIGDVGGVVMPNNDIYLYTNYSGTNPSVPSKDIIRFTLQNPTTGIHTFGREATLCTIFPNPTGEKLLITGLLSGTITLYNSFGQLVFKTEIQNIIDISTLPAGIYFIHLTDSKGVIVKDSKIIKE